MAKGFSVQLEDIPNPQTYARAGALTERAGETQGAANVAGAKATITGATALFELGKEAVKGYAEADIETVTKEAIRKYEDSPENARGRKVADAVKSYDARIASEPEGVSTSVTGREEPAVVALRDEAARFTRAQEQGLITKDETITRVADVVKKWSARLPGFQTEFRQTAADITGISKIDVYGIHKALTTESDNEKAALRAQKAQEAYIHDVAVYHGKPDTMVTQNDAQRYFAYKQLDGQQKNLENETKIRNFDTEQKGKAFDQLVSLKNAGNLVKLSTLFNDWGQANTDPALSKRRDQLAAQINDSIGAMRIETLGYATVQGGRMGIDVAKREADINTHYDSLEKVLKSKDGFDTLRQIIGRNKDSAEDMGNRFQLAFPALTMWGKIGIAPELIKVSFAPGGDKTLTRVLGKEGAAQIQNIGPDMAAFAKLMTRMYDPQVVAQHGPVDLRGTESAMLNADEKRSALLLAEGDVKMIPDIKDPSPEQVTQFATALGTLSKNTAPSDAPNLQRFNATMDNVNVQQFIDRLPAAQRAAIAAPIFNKHAQPVRDSVESMTTLIEQYNNDAGTNGTTMSIEQDASGRLIVVKEPVPTGRLTFAETPAGGVPGQAFEPSEVGGSRFAVSESGSAKQTQAMVEQRLAAINMNLTALGHAHTINGTGDMDTYKMGEMVVDGLKQGTMAGALTPGETRAEERATAAVAKPEPMGGGDYIKTRDSYIKLAEGNRGVVYHDNAAAKNPTIGVGYNLNNKDANEVLAKVLGFSKEDVTRLREGARVLKPAEIEKLYQHSIKDAEGKVDFALKGVELTDAQRHVSVILAFNVGSLTKAYVEALKNGDTQGAVNEVLYNTGVRKNASLAKRRYEEASILAREDPSVVLPQKDSYMKGTKPIKKAEGEPVRVAGIYGEPIQHPIPNPNDILGTRG